MPEATPKTRIRSYLEELRARGFEVVVSTDEYADETNHLVLATIPGGTRLEQQFPTRAQVAKHLGEMLFWARVFEIGDEPEGDDV